MAKFFIYISPKVFPSSSKVIAFIMHVDLLTFGYVDGSTNWPSIPNRMTDTRQVITPDNMIVLQTGCDCWITLKRDKLHSIRFKFFYYLQRSTSQSLNFPLDWDQRWRRGKSGIFIVTLERKMLTNWKCQFDDVWHKSLARIYLWNQPSNWWFCEHFSLTFLCGWVENIFNFHGKSRCAFFSKKTTREFLEIEMPWKLLSTAESTKLLLRKHEQISQKHKN